MITTRNRVEHRLYMQKWTAKRKRAGLCITCKSPAKLGRRQCEKHLCMQRAIQERCREKHRDKGECVQCGKKPPAGRTYCLKCLKRLKYYMNHPKSNSRKNLYGNRFKAIKRDKNRCQICSRKEKLVVHHIDRNGIKSEKPNHSLENLITLCNSCHFSLSKFLSDKRDTKIVIELLKSGTKVKR